jgi:pilus assembly protein FimV
MALALRGTYVQEWVAPKTEHIVKIRNAILGTSLWAVAAGASALSLGGSRGVVVLGAPVDLSFDIQPDPGTDLASSCVTAKLVAGDTVIGDAKVRVVPLPDMRGRSPAVRVQAAIAVDEPVLMVTLSAGCTGKVTRTYTFFAELPSTVARSASPVDVSRLPSLAAGGVEAPRPAQGAAGQRAAGAATAPVAPSPLASVPLSSENRPEPVPSTPSVAKPAARTAPVWPPQRSVARPQASAEKNKLATAPKPADRARLVVEPLDLWVDRPLALRTSPELLVMPSDQPSAQRAQAAALWKAMNAQPEDVNQEADRLKALESDVAALRAQAARDRASAAQLQQQLEQAESERFPATVVYALGGLLLLALLLAVWAWGRMRSASEKAVRAWRDSVAALGGRDAVVEHGAALGLPPDPSDHWLPSDESAEAREPSPGSAAAPLVPPFVATAPLPSAPVPLKATVPPPAPAAVVTQQPALHIVSPEELFDIQQQAEFFISVGEHQQAIEVLKTHIAERGATSPLAYLELLRLYHTLSRVEEFTQLRTQFMQSFNAQVPEFASFHRTGRMLYHYTDALADIEAEWTSPSVLQLLEKLLFRQNGVGSVEPFDLAAYDDLLLLLSIAQTTPASARGEPAPRKRTTPLAARRDETQVQQVPAPKVPATTAALPQDSRAASLEFDFDGMPPATGQPSQASGVAAPSALDGDTRGAPLDLDLDLDLSEPPHLTLSDLPAVPVTAPPAAGQAVGFGMDNDLVELRLELEQKKGDRK